jgi:hypothetical protein
VKRLPLALLSGLVVFGCGDGDDAFEERDSSPIVGAPEEVRTSGHRPDLAFKPVGAQTFSASFATHEVVVAADAAIELTAIADERRGVPIRFETSDVGRGELSIASRSLAVQQKTLSTLEVDRGAVAEEIENRDEGVEQRWRFGEKPIGVGALVVRVAVSGHSDVATSDSGLHFFAEDRLGFRYSHATWIDANGSAWSLPARWERDHIAINVPSTILDESAYPALLDPVIEPESGIDDLVAGTLVRSATAPFIATRNDGLFAVWSDRRRDGQTDDIWASRISITGTVQDFRGILVNGATGSQTTPVAARAGNLWVVAWNDVGDIAAATVSDTNVVTQLGDVAATSGTESAPAIAGQGTNAVLAWQVDGDIMASVFTAGAFGAPFSIAASAATEGEPAVGNSPTGFLVTWQDGTTSIKGQLLSTTGTPIGSVISIGESPNAKSQPAVAFNGTHYVVTFTSAANIFGVRVSPTGSVIDLTPVAIVTAAGLQIQSAVSCDTASCLVTYTDNRNAAATALDIQAQRVNFDLTPAGPEFAVQTAVRDQSLSSVARAGSTGWVAIWQDNRTGGPSQIVGTHINGSGVVGNTTGTVVTTTYAGAIAATTSTNGTQHFVSWSDSRVFGNDIRGQRYATISSPRQDNPPLLLSNAVNDQADPAMIFDGVNYLSVWSDARNADRDIFATRVSTTGVVLDPAGIPIATAARDQHLPDVASAGGGVSLVVWMDRRNGPFDIFGAIVVDGVVTVADIPICTAANDQDAPAVVYDPAGGVFVVVWSDKRGPSVSDIYGARVTTTGTVLDPNGRLVSGAQGGQNTPDIAISPSGVIMAVWDDRRTDPAGDIFGSRLSTAGGVLTVLDPGGIPIQTRPVNVRQNSPTIIGLPTTNQFVVVFTDHRNVATTGIDLFAQELTSTGQPASGLLGFPIATSVNDETSPKFQNDPNTQARVALMYNYFQPTFSTTRTFRRLLRFP